MSRRAVPKANSTAVRSTKGCAMSRRAVPKANSAAVRSTQGRPTEPPGRSVRINQPSVELTSIRYQAMP